MTICYKSEFKLLRDDKKVILKMIEHGKLLQYWDEFLKFKIWKFKKIKIIKIL